MCSKLKSNGGDRDRIGIHIPNPPVQLLLLNHILFSISWPLKSLRGKRKAPKEQECFYRLNKSYNC